MIEYFVEQMQRILYKNMSIGINVTDTAILSIADSFYDKTDDKYEA